MAATYPLAIGLQLLHGLSKHKLDVSNTRYEVAWIDGQIGQLQTSAAHGAATENADHAAAAGADDAGSSARAQQQQQQEVSHQPTFILQPPGTVATESVATEAVAAAVAGVGEPMEVDNQAAAPAVEGPGVATGGAEADDSSPVAAVTGDHGGIFIGSVQLSEVKTALAKAGFVSEFSAARRLVVAGSLVVSSDGPKGQLVMEGPLCDDYFRVRDVVYGQYNVC
eukprot:GHUV01030353.1.p1 GENE.GHUV01030353.1~~GHUV01030353.1.p1  ORF type:complete len:224 (-),score=80.42 GHUV01030353.1:252-923(-)